MEFTFSGGIRISKLFDMGRVLSQITRNIELLSYFQFACWTYRNVSCFQIFQICIFHGKGIFIGIFLGKFIFIGIFFGEGKNRHKRNWPLHNGASPWQHGPAQSRLPSFREFWRDTDSHGRTSVLFNTDRKSRKNPLLFVNVPHRPTPLRARLA